MIRIFDANNWARRRIEADKSGYALNGLFNEVHYQQDFCIVVWDGPKGNAKRRDIYPLYKTNRGKLDTAIFDQFRLLKELFKMANCVQICCSDWEADDVIAQLCKDNTDQQIHIHTTDSDLGQIPGVSTDRKETLVDSGYVVAYKISVGDSADNIKGIPGFGKGAWAKVNPHQFDYLLKSIINKKALWESLLKDISDLTPKVKNWLGDEDNHKVLREMNTIVNFFPVPASDMDAGTTFGTPNVLAVEKILDQFMLRGPMEAA